MFTRDDEWDNALRWMKGNEAAAHCLRILGESTQVLDDLTDESDAPLGKRSEWVVQTYDRLLVQLPANPFWREHVATLLPVFLNAVLEWDCSNEWQSSEHKAQHPFGFVRREALDSVVAIAAYLVGGCEWAREVAREVNLFYHVQHRDEETVEGWVSEVA